MIIFPKDEDSAVPDHIPENTHAKRRGKTRQDGGRQAWAQLSNTGLHLSLARHPPRSPPVKSCTHTPLQTAEEVPLPIAILCWLFLCGHFPFKHILKHTWRYELGCHSSTNQFWVHAQRSQLHPLSEGKSSTWHLMQSWACT